MQMNKNKEIIIMIFKTDKNIEFSKFYKKLIFYQLLLIFLSLIINLYLKD